MKALVATLLIYLCFIINLKFITGAQHYHEVHARSTKQFIQSWNR